MQEKYYKAIFKHTLLDTEFITSSKQCVLLISVGQTYHEAEKLNATVELLNMHDFKYCAVMLADTLQRHNYYTKMSQQEAYEYSLVQGDHWIKRNADILNQLTISYKIKRWDSCLQDSSYSHYRNILLNAYADDKSFKLAIDETIDKFINRRMQHDPHTCYEVHYQNCFDYLMEECPIIMPIWAQQGYDFIVYPNMMTTAMNAIYEKLVAPHYPNKAMWLSLRFKSKRIINNYVNASMNYPLNSAITSLN